MLLGITKLKGGPREAQAIINESPDFDLLYLDGINNVIEDEEKRKEMKRKKSLCVRRPSDSVDMEFEATDFDKMLNKSTA